jgi:hypothetical protein
VRAKNTVLHRNFSRSAFMPVGIARPVWGHLIMTTPTLVSSLLFSPVSVRHRLDCTASRGCLVQPIPAACKTALYEAFCRTLAKLFLIGSAVSVAIFRASSQSSLFCADVVSKLLRLCEADSWMISDSDFVPARWVRKSIAELVLAFEISMTLAP